MNANQTDHLIRQALQFRDTGDFESAIAVLESNTESLSDSAGAMLCLGALYQDSGRPEQALVHFDRVIVLAPWSANAWYNRGSALRTLKRYDESLVAYRRCLRIEPAHVEALINMGVLLQDLKRYEEAVACYEAALKNRPGAVNAAYNRALALENMGCFADAVAGYEQAITLAPGYPYLAGRLQHARMQLCDWTNYAAHVTSLCHSVALAQKASVPFPFLAMTDNPWLQRQCAEVFVADKFPAATIDHSWPAKRKPGRIRVGYFSADFRTHAVGFLTAGLFEQHQRADFEIFAFSLGAAPEGDLYRERIAASCEHFIDASRMADLEVVWQARAFELDIAVDLAGHTLDARTSIFARCLAPMQLSYLGYPGSMGAPYIDALLADAVVVPENLEPAYTEKILRLPGCFQVNDRQRLIGSVQTRRQYGLPEQGLVFASFNTSYKINPPIFDVWCRLLQAAPESVLWLLGESDLQKDNLRREASARGVDVTRLIFADRVPYSAHLARYAHVDLVLDTYPFNGGTSTSDALWGGAPVLTCAGAAFASRMSASLLQSSGLPDLVTESVAHYEATALALAADASKLAGYKTLLQNERMRCALFDTAARVRDIEDVYRTLVVGQNN